MRLGLGNTLVNNGLSNPDLLSLDSNFATDKTLTARRGPTPVFTRASGNNLGVTYIAPAYISTAYSFGGDAYSVTIVQTTSLNNGRFTWTDADTSLAYNGTAWLLSHDGNTVATSEPTTAYRPDLANWSGTGATISATNIFGNVLAANNEPRFDYNPTTEVCKGLLIEESRTNLVFPSIALTTQTRTVTAVAHTLSFYGTGTVVLSGAHVATVVGTGDFPTRTTLTFTPTAGSLILTVTGSVTEAQLEAGAFATSYIPTTTTTLQRTADLCSITGTAFSKFWNASEGSLFSQTQKISTNTNSFIVHASGNSFINGIDLRYNTVSQGATVMNVSGSSQLVTMTTNITSGSVIKQVLGYKVNDCAYSGNGASPVSDTTALIPTVSQMNIGTAFDNTLPLNGHIAAIRYYKKRLPNAKLQAITA